MVARRVAFLCVLLCLLATVPSNLKLVIAAGEPLRLTFVCHDDCWGEGEYCGRDAVVTTGVADMNHDCVVDGLDLALFYPELFSGVTGPGLSGDLDNNNAVGLGDLAIFQADLGMTAFPCHSVPIPTVCEGAIAISFNLNPANIVNTATQTPGTRIAYVVASGVANLRAIEFGLTTSPNITDLNVTFQAGLSGGPSGSWNFAFRSTSLTGAAVVARLNYTLTDSNPATITIEENTSPLARNRWTTQGAPVSHEFASITSAGINGPAPPVTASCTATGTITGQVYEETDNDCVFDGTPLEGQLVMAMPGPYFGSTDANGNYSIAVEAGQYDVSLLDSKNPLSPCQDPSLVVNITSGQVSVGNDFALEPPATVCHDGVWEDGEYCGRDAYTASGVADMNHDCIVDGLDYVLFLQQYPSCGADLSGDLNGDGMVNAADFAALNATLGDAAIPCNSTPIPDQCDGIMALSFHTSPTLIVNNASQAPGATYSVWLVVNGVINAGSVEALIKTSPNVVLGAVTWLGGTGPTTPSSGNPWGAALFNPPLTGAVTIAKLDYFLADSDPATISIIAPTLSVPWGSNRWAPPDVSVSHRFSVLGSVGINGPTPGLSFPCGSLGQITGTVYSDPDHDCDLTGADTRLSNRTVKAEPGPHFAYTDANGDYSFSLAPGEYTVSMNGFNSPWTALSPCQVPPTHVVDVTANTTIPGKDFALEPNGTITGRVFHDSATPCAYDAGTDVGLAGRRVEANPGNFVAYTDLNGNYSLKLPVGAYTVTQPAPALDPWVFPVCFAGSYAPNVALNTTTTGLDFPLNLAGPACHLAVRIASNPVSFGPPPCDQRIVRGVCPSIEHEYLFWVWGDPYLSNTTIPANRPLTIQLDPAFTINNVTGPVTIVASPNAYTRTVQFTTAIPPGTLNIVKVRATPSTFGPYTAVASFNPGMACLGTLVTSLSETSNCNSCDPNDMAVQPGCGPDGEVLADEPLIYTTRFQNVGLGAAENIVIETMLDENLDPNTLYIVNASHTVTGVQLEAGNKLVISFDNINLPGTPDAPNSHGYVIYSINQDPGLPDGTEITNTAAIFFDFNDPVITNTALTTVKDEPCAPTAVEQPRLPVKTYMAQNHPNPFNPTTTIEYGLASPELVSIKLYNVRGQLVRTLVNEHKAPGWYNVDWDGRDQRGNVVASGVYVSRMSTGSFVDTKKLILLK